MKTLTILVTLVATALSQEILEVTCGQDAIEARFNKQTALAAEYTMQELHFNDPSCIFDSEEGEYYVKRIEPLSSCGTDITVNKTHAKYTNSISSGEIETGLSFPHGIIVGQPENNRLISVSYECTYKIDLRVSSAFIPNITILKIPIPDAIGEGFFQVAMALYEDATYHDLKTTPGTVPVLQPEETVFVGVTMVGETSEDVFILMQRCWATPNEDPDSEPYYDLITDSCPVKDAVQGSLTVTQNGVGQQALWQTKVFRFVGDGDSYQNVWLHCDLTLCVQRTCEPTCSARRKRSVGDGKKDNIVSLGPFTKQPRLLEEENFNINEEIVTEILIKNESSPKLEEDVRHLDDSVRRLSETMEKIASQLDDKPGVEKHTDEKKWYEDKMFIIIAAAVVAFCVICFAIALIAILMRWKSNNTARQGGHVTPTGTINKGFDI